MSRAKLRLRGLRFREQDATGISPQELRRIDTGFAIALALSTVDTIRGADIQTRQLLAALKAGEPYRIARGIALEAAFNAAGGGVDAHARTDRLVRTARSLAQRIDNPHALGLAAWAEGSSAYLEGRFAAAHSLSEQAVTIYRDRCRGVAWEVASAQIFSLWAASYLGTYREIAARMPALLAAADAREDRYDSTNLRASHTNTVWLAADQPQEATAQIEHAMRQWAPRGFHLPHYYELYARTQNELYTGDVRAAWQRITDGWSKLDRALLFRLQIIRIEATFLRARDRDGTRDRRSLAGRCAAHRRHPRREAARRGIRTVGERARAPRSRRRCRRARRDHRRRPLRPGRRRARRRRHGPPRRRVTQATRLTHPTWRGRSRGTLDDGPGNSRTGEDGCSACPAP